MGGEIETSHIEEAYKAVGDGFMAECLGKDCPSSCCGNKFRMVGTGGLICSSWLQEWKKVEILINR